MSVSLEVIVMKDGLIKKKESLRLELKKLIKERDEFNETTNDVEHLKKRIRFHEEVEKNLKKQAINPNNKDLLIEYQQLLKEAFDANFFNEATIYNDKQTPSSIPQEGVTNVITKHPSHMNCKFKEVSEEYQFNISALENSATLIGLKNKLFLIQSRLEHDDFKIGDLEREINVLELKIKEVQPLKPAFIFNDAENALNLSSQEQIQANAKKLGIPLHIPKPAGAPVSLMSNVQNINENPVEHDGTPELNTPIGMREADKSSASGKAAGSLIFSCPLAGVKTVECQRVVMIGYERGNLWRHGRPQYGTQSRTVTTYPDGNVVYGDWH